MPLLACIAVFLLPIEARAEMCALHFSNTDWKPLRLVTLPEPLLSFEEVYLPISSRFKPIAPNYVPFHRLSGTFNYGVHELFVLYIRHS